jgi:hypothetical protein
MANTDPELAKAAQLAYERSNVSLNDYNPDELAPEDKVNDVNGEAPLEPVLTTADSGIAGLAADKSDSSTKTTGDTSSTSSASKSSK